MALFGNLAPLNSLLHQHFPIFRQSHLSSLVDDSRELYYPIYWGWRIRHGGAEENQRVERDDVAAIERCSLVHRVKIPSNYRHTDYRYIHCTAQFFFCKAARVHPFTASKWANKNWVAFFQASFEGEDQPGLADAGHGDGFLRTSLREGSEMARANGEKMFVEQQSAIPNDLAFLWVLYIYMVL